MNYTNISLITERGIHLALSNEFPNSVKLTDAIEDAKDANALLIKLKLIPSYVKEFSLDRETETYIRYKLIANMCNNVQYLIIYK